MFISVFIQYNVFVVVFNKEKMWFQFLCLFCKREKILQENKSTMSKGKTILSLLNLECIFKQNLTILLTYSTKIVQNSMEIRLKDVNLYRA